MNHKNSLKTTLDQERSHAWRRAWAKNEREESRSVAFIAHPKQRTLTLQALTRRRTTCCIAGLDMVCCWIKQHVRSRSLGMDTFISKIMGSVSIVQVVCRPKDTQSIALVLNYEAEADAAAIWPVATQHNSHLYFSRAGRMELRWPHSVHGACLLQVWSDFKTPVTNTEG